MVDVELAASLTAPAAARCTVRLVLADRLDPDALDGVVLLVSELVTNVVRHAGTPVELRVWVDDQLVVVKVCDGSPRAPVVRRQDPEATSGCGMLLIDRLATRWGVEPAGSGKCVWFELHHDDPPTVEDHYVFFDVDSVDPI